MQWKVRRTGLSGLVACGACGRAGGGSVVGAISSGCEAEPRVGGGTCGQEMGVEPGLLYEGAIAQLLPGAEGAARWGQLAPPHFMPISRA